MGQPAADQIPEEEPSETTPLPPASGLRVHHRSRRKRDVRARTVSIKRMTKRELELGRLLYPADEESPIERPRTRADCESVPRPCPFVSCKHHLYLDVSPRTGAIKLNFPDLEVEDMKESCTLDVADRMGETLEEVGAIMNLTRERVRQIEVTGLARSKARVEGRKDLPAVREYVSEVASTPAGKRRLPILQPEDDDDPDEFDVERFASDALGE